MAALVIRSLVERTGIEPAEIDDVILGAANQAGEDNRNVGRMAALLAGLPIEVPGQDRQPPVRLRSRRSWPQPMPSALATVPFYAGGVESMTRAPLVTAKLPPPSREEQTMFDTTLGWRFTNPRLADAYYPYSMGETAENVVERCASRARSRTPSPLHRSSAGRPPTTRPLRRRDCPDRHAGRQRRGRRASPTRRHARSLAALKPAFKRDASGSVTAGNSSGINDGAARRCWS